MKKVTYVALDVHPHKIVAMWGRAQEMPRTMKVGESAQELQRLRTEVGPGEVWVTYEASSCGFVLYDRLSAWGWKAWVLAPTKMARSVRSVKRKTDLEDVKRQWELMVAHGELGTSLPSVWVPPVKTREDRELVRHRLWLAEEQGRIKTKIRSLLRMHGIESPIEEKSLWTKQGLAWLKGLEARLARSLSTVLGSHLRMLATLKEEIGKLDEEIERLSQEDPYRVPIEAAMTEKGVGRLTAMTFATEIGDVKRFENRKQLGSYLGLTPTSYESGQATDRKGHISRMGPYRIRKVLNQAAWAYVRTRSERRAWYEAMAKRRGKKKALVAVMRELGILIWHRMRDAVA